MGSEETVVTPVAHGGDSMFAPLRRRGALAWRSVPVLAAISAGGVLGAVSRYGLDVLLPHRGDAWPWSTWLVNTSGCLLIGVLMALLTEVWPGHRLLRPFLGIGVLGGYTTFSTATVEVTQLVRAGAPGLGLAYLAGTMLAALIAVAAGWAGAGSALRRARQKGRRP